MSPFLALVKFYKKLNMVLGLINIMMTGQVTRNGFLQDFLEEGASEPRTKGGVGRSFPAEGNLEIVVP